MAPWEVLANPSSRGATFAGSAWQGPGGAEVVVRVCVCVCVHALRAGPGCLSDLALVITRVSPRKSLPSIWPPNWFSASPDFPYPSLAPEASTLTLGGALSPKAIPDGCPPPPRAQRGANEVVRMPHRGGASSLTSFLVVIIAIRMIFNTQPLSSTDRTHRCTDPSSTHSLGQQNRHLVSSTNPRHHYSARAARNSYHGADSLRDVEGRQAPAPLQPHNCKKKINNNGKDIYMYILDHVQMEGVIRPSP